MSLVLLTSILLAIENKPDKNKPDKWRVVTTVDFAVHWLVGLACWSASDWGQSLYN